MRLNTRVFSLNHLHILYFYSGRVGGSVRAGDRNVRVRACNTLQHIAKRCNTLQHTATHCSTQICMFQNFYSRRDNMSTLGVVEA